jgi:hypothetical protein
MKMSLFLLSEWEINDIINVGYFSQSVMGDIRERKDGMQKKTPDYDNVFKTNL